MWSGLKWCLVQNDMFDVSNDKYYTAPWHADYFVRCLCKQRAYLGRLQEARSYREESPSGNMATSDALRSLVQPDASVRLRKLPNSSVSFWVCSWCYCKEGKMWWMKRIQHPYPTWLYCLNKMAVAVMMSSPAPNFMQPWKRKNLERNVCLHCQRWPPAFLAVLLKQKNCLLEKVRGQGYWKCQCPHTVKMKEWSCDWMQVNQAGAHWEMRMQSWKSIVGALLVWCPGNAQWNLAFPSSTGPGIHIQSHSQTFPWKLFYTANNAKSWRVRLHNNYKPIKGRKSWT